MLRITYAPNDTQLAQRLQNDLSKEHLQLESPVVIVLISPEASTDPAITKEIEEAIARGDLIFPVLVRKTSLPQVLRPYTAFDMTRGYEQRKLVAALRRAVIERHTKKANRRLLIGLSIVVVFVFSVAVWSIASGIIAFPADEFATENAIQQQMIETFSYPTLNPLMPRTTEDAIAFPRTVEAANTRNAPLLQATASALPISRQATQDAIATSADMTLTARAQATETVTGD